MLKLLKFVLCFTTRVFALYASFSMLYRYLERLCFTWNCRWWKRTRFATTWWGCLSSNPDDFDRNISSILQYLFFLGLYSISSILMLNSEFLPWVIDVSPSSTLQKKTKLEHKKEYTVCLCKKLICVVVSNWCLYFDSKLVVTNWF